MGRLWPCLILLLLLAGRAAAGQAKARDDDIAEYYRAAAYDEAAAMLAAAPRLARRHQSSYWPTIVAEHYWHGRGAQADPVEAVAWYRRAAVRGGELAKHALARSHYRGLGAEQDVEAVIFWLEQARRHKHARAMLELAIYNRRGIPYARDQKLVDAAATAVSKSSSQERASRPRSIVMRCRPCARPMSVHSGSSPAPGRLRPTMPRPVATSCWQSAKDGTTVRTTFSASPSRIRLSPAGANANDRLDQIPRARAAPSVVRLVRI